MRLGVVFPQSLLAAVLCLPFTVVALDATIWNGPIIPVPMSFNVWFIAIEVRVEGLADTDLYTTIQNITITGNEDSNMFEPYNFWSPGSTSDGNTITYAGEANQQNIRIMSDVGIPRLDNMFANTTDYAIVFFNLIVTAKEDLPTSMTVSGYLSNDSFFTSPQEKVLDPSNAIKLGNPLKGTEWVVTNGLDNLFSSHRRAVQRMLPPTLNTTTMLQKHAIDWVKYAPDRTLFTGDGSKNEDWHCYKQELYAVAPGTVIRVKTDLVDHEPFTKPPYNITFDTVLGNHVIIDIGNELYAMYAHMNHDSATVKVGDEVEKGQVIGLLGSTGNSDAPHLHLHISTCDTGVKCPDHPYVLEEYTSLTRLNNHPMIPGVFYTGPTVYTPAFQNTRPLPGEVLNFGGNSTAAQSAARRQDFSLFAAVASLSFVAWMIL